MTESASASGSPLHGCTVVVTRERRGELGRMLAAAGAEVVHVPLIEVVDAPADEVARLHRVLRDGVDWAVVTSVAGAERLGSLVRDRPAVQLAAVGSATARMLSETSGRPVNLVPDRQIGRALAEVFNATHPSPRRVLVAQADRASSELSDLLRSGGHHVRDVTAYRTVLRRPSNTEVAALRRADAVSFASGSAAIAWSDAFGDDAVEMLPGIVAAIGPTTAAVAEEIGLKVTHVAADHSVSGLVDSVVTAWSHQKK